MIISLVRSWVDHVLITSHHANLIDNVHCIYSSSNLSDHCPLVFSLSLNKSPLSFGGSTVPPNPTARSLRNAIDWSHVTSTDLLLYHQKILCSLPEIPQSLLDCCQPACIHHRSLIDSLCDSFSDSLLSSASSTLPVRQYQHSVFPGWNDHIRHHKSTADFWNVLWRNAGCPSSGHLFNIRLHTKKICKYAIRPFHTMSPKDPFVLFCNASKHSLLCQLFTPIVL